MNANDDSKMRITDQFRDKGSMVYDLKGCGVRMSLRVSERTDSSQRWEIAALAKAEPPVTPLTARAATRREALACLARVWTETEGFPAVDWPSIDDALAAVRAI